MRTPGRITYVGHATVLAELGGIRILTDPLLRRRLAHVRRRVPLPEDAELMPVDAIVISHAHADHLDLDTLKRVARGRLVIAPRGCGRIIRRAQPADVIELDAGDRFAVGTVEVEAFPALHDGRRHPLGRHIEALSFLLDRLYFAGDTDLFDGMGALAGRVDVALLPIWGWGPRLPAGHLNPQSAARAVALIEPAVAVPIHWGTMRSIGAGRHAESRAPAAAFADAVASLGVAARAQILAPGEAMRLPPLVAAAGS